MSKQYLTLHTVDAAHPSDIFALAPRPTQLLSASGASSIKVHDTTASDFPLVQTIDSAHETGIHHLVTAKAALRAASVGFDGGVKIWKTDSEGGEWTLEGQVKESNKPGDVWAITLSADGNFLASSSINGKINVWSLSEAGMPKIREYETKGSFGICVNLSADGRYTASGHQNGSIYVFDNDTGRLTHSVAGLVEPVRSVAFSPASRLLAAAGDARVIALYDVKSGEQVGNLVGHNAWIMTLDWSDTGEYLLSGSHDGKAKIWRIETRTCVATHSHGDKPLWTAKWLPKQQGRSEMFALAGGNKAISFYREAAG